MELLTWWPVIVVLAGVLVMAGHYRHRFESLERRLDELGKALGDDRKELRPMLEQMAVVQNSIHAQVSDTTAPWAIEHDESGRVTLRRRRSTRSQRG